MAPLLGPIASVLCWRDLRPLGFQGEIFCVTHKCAEAAQLALDHRRDDFSTWLTLPQKKPLCVVREVIWQVQPCIGSMFTTRSNGQRTESPLFPKKREMNPHLPSISGLYILFHPYMKEQFRWGRCKVAWQVEPCVRMRIFYSYHIGSKDMLNCTAFWSSSWQTFFAAMEEFMLPMQVKYIKTSYLSNIDFTSYQYDLIYLFGQCVRSRQSLKF